MNFPALLKQRPVHRRSRRSGRPPVLLKEVQRGAAVGGCNGFAWSLVAGGPPWTALCAAAACSAVGALVGVLLWSGSEAIPEDPVVPPRQKRDIHS